MPTSQIRLSVPAEPEFARSVRMLAANLAVVCGMGIDDVEDVRMACEEAFVFACATGPSSVSVAFSASEGRLDSEFSLGTDRKPTADPSAEPAWAYADLILSAVCDSYEVDVEAGVLRLAKRTDVAHAS
jgi:serine/threonine-protein kinase RsbW